MSSSTGIARFAGLLVAGFLAALATGVQSGSAVTPGSRAAGLDACVAPTAEMRRNHMDYLKHDRNDTVHKGIRDTRASLAACVDCHAAKNDAGDYMSINAAGQFCDKCHNYMAVSLACFQCHRKTPAGDVSGKQSTAGGAGRPLGLLLDPGERIELTAEEKAQLQALTGGE